MKVAIMQPYLFPYIGYFQLVANSDAFIFLDNVQFINRGWVNRNYILSNGNSILMSLPLKKSSRDEWIKHKEISAEEYMKSLVKLNKTIQRSYSSCINFLNIDDMIKQVLNKNAHFLSDIVENSVTKVSEYLKINTDFYRASDLISDQESSSFTASERIINLVNKLGGTEYINLIGGRDMYDKKWFLSKGVKLSFLTPEIIPYPQISKTFIPSLSIIDVLMNNEVTYIQDMLYPKTMLKE